jgi:hypothetical protein
MISALVGFAFLLVVLVMATLGAVLLVRFLLGGRSHSTRVLAAASAGPMTIVLPFLGVAIADIALVDPGTLVGFAILFLMCVGAIGWPVAHFATRRLDRLTRFDPQVFE